VCVFREKGAHRTSGQQLEPGAFLLEQNGAPPAVEHGAERDHAPRSRKENLMVRLVAAALSILFGLYCVVWAIAASSYPAQQRFGGAFVGVLLFLLALVYMLVLRPDEQASSGSPT
jgi:hypothetical protein